MLVDVIFYIISIIISWRDKVVMTFMFLKVCAKMKSHTKLLDNSRVKHNSVFCVFVQFWLNTVCAFYLFLKLELSVAIKWR